MKNLLLTVFMVLSISVSSFAQETDPNQVISTSTDSVEGSVQEVGFDNCTDCSKHASSLSILSKNEKSYDSLLPEDVANEGKSPADGSDSKGTR